MKRDTRKPFRKNTMMLQCLKASPPMQQYRGKWMKFEPRIVSTGPVSPLVSEANSFRNVMANVLATHNETLRKLVD